MWRKEHGEFLSFSHGGGFAALPVCGIIASETKPFWLCTTFHGGRFAWAAGRTGSPFYLKWRRRSGSRYSMLDTRYSPQGVPDKQGSPLRFDFRSHPRCSILCVIATPATRAVAISRVRGVGDCFAARLCRNSDFAPFGPDLEQKTKVVMPILVYFCHYDTACALAMTTPQNICHPALLSREQAEHSDTVAWDLRFVLVFK